MTSRQLSEAHNEIAQRIEVLRSKGSSSAVSPPRVKDAPQRVGTADGSISPGETRRRRLEELFLAIDTDSSGWVEKGEVLEMGRLSALSTRLVAKIREFASSGMSGRITKGDFVTAFDRILPGDAALFDNALVHLLQFQQTHQVLSSHAASQRRSTRKKRCVNEVKCVDTSQRGSVDQEVLIQLWRRQQLSEVFQLFDLDGNNILQSSELMELGLARRECGQKESVWTAAKNQRLVSRLDRNKHTGVIEEEEFVVYFNRSLSNDPQEFLTVIADFRVVALRVRHRKLATRDSLGVWFDRWKSSTIEQEAAHAVFQASRQKWQWYEKQLEWHKRQLASSLLKNAELQKEVVALHQDVALQQHEARANARLVRQLKSQFPVKGEASMPITKRPELCQ